MLTSRSTFSSCWLVLVCCLLSPAPMAAGTQQGDPRAGDTRAITQPSGPDEEADHESLRRLRQVYERAVNEDQVDLLGPYLHPDFFGVMVTNDHVRNLEDMRAYWQRIKQLIGEGGRYTTTMKPELSVIVGDFAFARGTTDDVVVTGDGDEYRFSTSWTVVCQRDGGQWRVFRAQGTMDPVQNEFVRTFMRRAILQTGLIAGLVGLTAGWLLAILFRRFRARRV
jgi:ketosteroid isomerase-like protein